MNVQEGSVRCILFDLDGTLYNSSEYSNHLEDEISRLISEELKIDELRAKLLLDQNRRTIGTLTCTIESLGMSRISFHRKMASRIEPRTYLLPGTEVRVSA